MTSETANFSEICPRLASFLRTV